jgi:hypothetical protein
MKAKKRGKCKYSFEDAAIEMTKIDIGGEAKRQLDITEARQALSSFLAVAYRFMTLENVAALIAGCDERDEQC